MDADDITHPERLARQYALFAEHDDVVLIGTLCDGIDATGRHVRPRDRWRLLRASLHAPFPHGSVMFRRAAFEEAGGYREECAYWEDIDLFLRMTGCGRVLVLPDLLYRYRYHQTNITGRAPVDVVTQICATRLRCLDEYGAGRDYATMLTPSEARADTSRGTAEALYQMAAMRLWAGQPTSILRDVLTRHLRLSPRAVLTIIVAAWGSLSTPTLRAALRAFISTRDRLAGLRIRDGRPYEWRLR
jgi:hypothetical protein